MSLPKEQCCFVTGHRLNRFHFPESDPLCKQIKKAIREEIKRLYKYENIRGLWVGGASGVDTWAAEEVLKLRRNKEFEDLQLYAAIPFPGFNEDAPPRKKERYQRILSECADSVVVCNKMIPDAYKRRNYYMVDHSACGIAVYAAERYVRSGTRMTLNYATKKKGLPVMVIDPDTAKTVPYATMDSLSPQTLPRSK